MTTAEVMQVLEKRGNAQTKKILTQHGAKEPFFGVKVADLKTLVKSLKKQPELAEELYQTGNSDAMYLAGLIADPKQFDKAQLQAWAEQAYWYMLSEYTVAWVAAESDYGYEIALEWIESEEERLASAGWATLSCLTALKSDEALDIDYLSALIDRVSSSIHQAANRVRYTMNGFVIAAGSNVAALTEQAQVAAEQIGKVEVFMGTTNCKVPFATTYLQKVIDKGRIGKKRKTFRK